jgi:preprotein translocase subunit YajC
VSGLGFLILIVLLLGLWLIVIRPQRRRQSEQQQMQNVLEVGDEIVTAGGIYGTVTALRDDDLVVEIAPGTEVRMARRAVAGVFEPEEVEEEAEDDSGEESSHEAAETAAAEPEQSH